MTNATPGMIAMVNRRMTTVIGVAMFAAFALCAVARAQVNFPTQTVTLVVPFPAGGPPDIIARILQPRLQALLGKPVVVENRAGGSGALGAAQVARAAPDGHTILMVDPAHAVAQNLMEKPGFDPLKDFAYILPTMRSWIILVVHPSVPAKTVAEFIALAKSRPGDIKYGTSGVGSPPYLGGLAFTMATGVELTHVPYRGAALAMNDLIGGHIQAVFGSPSTTGPHIREGKLRGIAVFGNERVRNLPDVPTFKESGLDTPVANEGVFFGAAAPAGTPAPVIEKLNAAFNEALRDPQVREALAKADFSKFDGGNPEELRRLMDVSVAYWRDLFQRAGVKPE